MNERLNVLNKENNPDNRQYCWLKILFTICNIYKYSNAHRLLQGGNSCRNCNCPPKILHYPDSSILLLGSFYYYCILLLFVQPHTSYNDLYSIHEIIEIVKDLWSNMCLWFPKTATLTFLPQILNQVSSWWLLISNQEMYSSSIFSLLFHSIFNIYVRGFFCEGTFILFWTCDPTGPVNFHRAPSLMLCRCLSCQGLHLLWKQTEVHPFQ